MKLVAKNLTVKIKNSEYYLLKETSIDVSFNNCGLFGPSGSGKSTVLNILLGLLNKNLEITGELYFFKDKKMNNLKLGKDICVIPQDANNCFDPNIKMGKQLYMSFLVAGYSKQEAMKKVQLVIEKCKLPCNILKLYPNELSGGMLQRCVLGLAIFIKPKIVIADEPLSALDKENKKIILNLLKELTILDCNLLVASHNLEEIKYLCDKVIIFDNGKLETSSLEEACLRKNNYVSRILKSYEELSTPNFLVRPKEKLITLENISKIYKYGFFNKKNIVLDDINLIIRKYENIAFLGNSGVGKTTLIKIILGISKPTSGRITYYFDNTKVGNFSIVFQNIVSSFDPKYSVLDILQEVGEVEEEQIVNLLKDVGLEKDIINRSVDKLSGGQIQRLSIARAIALKPKILVLDEAFSSLDYKVSVDILQILKKLQLKYEITYLLITHDEKVAKYLCPRIIKLANCKVDSDISIFEKIQEK